MCDIEAASYAHLAQLGDRPSRDRLLARRHLNLRCLSRNARKLPANSAIARLNKTSQAICSGQFLVCTRVTLFYGERKPASLSLSLSLSLLLSSICRPLSLSLATSQGRETSCALRGPTANSLPESHASIPLGRRHGGRLSAILHSTTATQ